ncbi:hypothetical protein AB4037_08495 [Labrys sp. KB_33_2]|uniref:hypothetical protein n=1 Tax=Labrys sp. KB_33_2 TaxID=3237479 RepID=UPI003F918C92
MPNQGRDWLDQWVGENLVVPQYMDSPDQLADEVRACRNDARAAGISPEDLEAAADGDLAAFLFDAQNALTDRERRRLEGNDP